MRGLLFDKETNHLVGHATLYDVEDDVADVSSGYPHGGDSPPQRDEDLDVFIEIVAQALALLAIYGIEKAAPHVRDWWQEKASPSLKSKAVPAVKAVPGKVKAVPGKVKATLKRKSRSKPDEDADAVAAMATLDDGGMSALATGRGPGVEVRGPVMSSAEASQRLSHAVAAMAFAREQMRVLHDATIVDDEGPVALASMLNELSPEHLEQAIRAVLNANPRMLEPSTSPAIMASLPMGRPDADLQPLRTDGAEDGTPPR